MYTPTGCTEGLLEMWQLDLGTAKGAILSLTSYIPRNDLHHRIRARLHLGGWFEQLHELLQSSVYFQGRCQEGPLTLGATDQSKEVTRLELSKSLEVLLLTEMPFTYLNSTILNVSLCVLVKAWAPEHRTGDSNLNCDHQPRWQSRCTTLNSNFVRVIKFQADCNRFLTRWMK
jgi:hypothetical protein